MSYEPRQFKTQNSKLRTPEAVTGVALLGYLLIFYVFFNHYQDLRGFIWIGKNYVEKSQLSSEIRPDPDFRYQLGGYDGQFAYFLALDPANARYYMDRESYRYTRILYPITVRLAALGNRDWVPLTLILVNWLAITAGTWAVAAWCLESGLSPWLGLVYAFAVGQVIAFTRDLNEPLAFALVALAVYIYERRPRHRLWAGLVFGLAALAREAALIFGALYALRGIWEWGHSKQKAEGRKGRHGGTAPTFAALAIGPAVAWQVFLLLWLGKTGLNEGQGLLQAPLSPFYYLYPLRPETLDVIQIIVVPGVVCLAVGLLLIWKSQVARRSAAVWAMVLNVLLFVLLLPLGSLIDLLAAGRVSLGVVLAAIYSLVYTRSRGWFYFCAGLWLAATAAYLANPVLELLHGRG
jgi:hypothetical protein